MTYWDVHNNLGTCAQEFVADKLFFCDMVNEARHADIIHVTMDLNPYVESLFQVTIGNQRWTGTLTMSSSVSSGVVCT
jgi:hypothetical protein